MKNDARIAELKKQIKIKREEIGDVPEFEPITNCSLRMASGELFDLRTIKKDVATSILVDFNSRRLSAVNLEIPYRICGHPIEDWIADIKARLAQLDAEREQGRLYSLEMRLARLLSEKEKTRLAIDAIADEM